MIIRDVELSASEQWYSCSYTDADERVYDVVFINSYMHDIGYESKELSNVLLNGESVDIPTLWDRIKEDLEETDVTQK